MKKNNFKIITPVFNSEKWIKKCIDSLKSQTYKNFEVVIINDCSTDGTAKIIKKEIADDKRFFFIDNKAKSCALENTVKGIHYICKEDEDIIVIVDGDDWLASNDVLEHLNEVYQKDIWVTWGQFKLVSDNKICKTNNENWCIGVPAEFNRKKIKRFDFSPLRTYKYFLFNAIKQEDLRDKNGKYYTTAGDVVIALPLIEMAGKDHRKCINKLMYCYNNMNQLNDMKLDPKKQVDLYNAIRYKLRYKQHIKTETYNAKEEKVDILIWAKDRACQLDLLLRSIKDNFVDYNKIYVRYDYTSPDFKKGFTKVTTKDYGLPITYIETSGDFEKDTKEVIYNKMETKYMLNLCDDDVFKRPTAICDILGDYTDEVCAISLRMSEDILWCYGTQKKSPLPKFYPMDSNGLKWKWADSDPSTDWGYPSAVNIHIYRTEWFKKVIKDLHFDTPNKLEYLFNTNRKIFKPYIISLKKTRILNIPVNQVQTMCPTNPYGKTYSYTLKELNDKFLNGYIINTENIYSHFNRGVNEEIKLNFIKEK